MLQVKMLLSWRLIRLKVLFLRPLQTIADYWLRKLREQVWKKCMFLFREFIVTLAGVDAGLAMSASGVSAVVLTRKGLTCPHCGALGINGTCKLKLHIDRMHSKPYTCRICNVEFVDRYFFDMHSPTCFYYCPSHGCNFKEKREERLMGHLRRHSMK